jgi:carboxyl-terminal processing protease
MFANKVQTYVLDLLALALAAYFTNEPVLAFTRKAVVGDGYTPITEIYIDPNPDPKVRYDGKIILMTSEVTPNILSMTMTQLPQVTLLGKNSWGDTNFADCLWRDLPNGYAVLFSNQVYQLPDGTCYDGIGVPPNILEETEFMNKTELDADVNTWLELALKTAQQMIDDAGNTTDPPEIPSGVSARAALHALVTVAFVAAATSFSYHV